MISTEEGMQISRFTSFDARPSVLPISFTVKTRPSQQIALRAIPAVRNVGRIQQTLSPSMLYCTPSNSMEKIGTDEARCEMETRIDGWNY
jgi:hypothetical protein